MALVHGASAFHAAQPCASMPPLMLRNALKALGIVLLIVLVGGSIFVAMRQNLKFVAPYPEVVASSDPAVIARGQYIVRTAAPCAACHGDPKERANWFTGA